MRHLFATRIVWFLDNELVLLRQEGRSLRAYEVASATCGRLMGASLCLSLEVV